MRRVDAPTRCTRHRGWVAWRRRTTSYFGGGFTSPALGSCRRTVDRRRVSRPGHSTLAYPYGRFDRRSRRVDRRVLTALARRVECKLGRRGARRRSAWQSGTLRHVPRRRRGRGGLLGSSRDARTRHCKYRGADPQFLVVRRRVPPTLPAPFDGWHDLHLHASVNPTSSG